MTDRPQLSFKDYTGLGVRVAVVDSGIDSTHPKLGNVAGGVDLTTGTGDQSVRETYLTDPAGHGTACAGVIMRKAPNAQLFSVKIFDEALGTDGQDLVRAVEWAIEHRMDVVNLSLGTTEVAFHDEMLSVCKDAMDAGIVLVAAEHNEHRVSYPAVLPDVIGVASGKVYGLYSYFYRPGEAIECVARGDAQRLFWTEHREVMTGGTSFAAPHISGIVALIREAVPQAPLQQVRAILKESATQGQPEEPIGGSSGLQEVHKPLKVHSTAGSGGYHWIRKAALYPYNKEMHGFIRNLDDLAFQVVGVADPAGKGLVGKDAGTAIGIDAVGISIVPRLRDALAGADTLILGYVDELARIAKRDVLRESIEIAVEEGLNIFSLLPVPPTHYSDLYSKAKKRKLTIAFPHIPLAAVKDLLQNPPNRDPVGVPVLGVFGTSAQQGKFTVQLALRRILLKRGFQVVQIGTEHHCELFGMDFSFPIGYASPLELPTQTYIPFLDVKMGEICRNRKPDIVLVGAQSGTIPYDIREHATHTLSSIAFLLGTKPDACVLVVNSIDPYDYIKDTIEGIRTIGKAPTILLAMSDKEKHIRTAYGRTWVTPRQLSASEVSEKLGELEETFGLPAVEIVSEAGQQRMVDVVIQHFSSHKQKEHETA